MCNNKSAAGRIPKKRCLIVHTSKDGGKKREMLTSGGTILAVSAAGWVDQRLPRYGDPPEVYVGALSPSAALRPAKYPSSNWARLRCADLHVKKDAKRQKMPLAAAPQEG